MKNLSAKQYTFIQALLSGNNIVVAGKAAGVSESTARRWIVDTDVRQAYLDAQKEVFDGALTTLKLAIPDAIRALTRHMNAEDTPASTQVRAAQIVLEQAVDLHKMSELEQKIADLESRLGNT